MVRSPCQCRPIPSHRTFRNFSRKWHSPKTSNASRTQIHAASDLDHILLDLRKEILSIFDAEDLTIFAFDSEKKEIFSKIPHIDSVEEIRIPITEQSLAGFCAKYLRPVNIADAYNLAELQGVHPSLLHDTSYDKRTGFKTKQVLTYPIVADNKYLMGVLNSSTKRAADDSREKTKNPSRRLPRHSASPSLISARSSKKAPTKFDLLVTNNRSHKTIWTMPLPSPEKAPSDFECILIEKYKVPKPEIGKSLAQFHKCPYIEYSDRTLVDIELLKNLNVDYLKKNHWMPLKRDRTAIEILTDDPGDLDRVAGYQTDLPRPEYSLCDQSPSRYRPVPQLRHRTGTGRHRQHTKVG